MSGHSHWSKIKHDKKSSDIQRGKLFSKIIKLITIATRDGGNPNENPKLREAMEKAKEVNMPSNNIERAIKRGTGELGGAELQEISFEAYGPGNIAIIIEGITDNKNRTIAEVKQMLSKNKGKLAAEGSVKWLFNRKGVIILNINEQAEELKNKEKMELLAIDSGAQDIKWDNNFLQIYAEVNDLESTKDRLIEQGIKIDSSNLDWVAKNEISISEKDAESADKLFSALEENDDVQEVYSNLSFNFGD